MILRLAVRNVLRHRTRSTATLIAIAFGVAAILLTGGFIHDLYRQLGETIIRSQSGHLQVAQPELFAHGSRSPEKHRIDDLHLIKKELQATPGVRTAMARLTFTGLLGNGRTDIPVMVEGIEMGKEAELMTSVTMLSGALPAAAQRDAAFVGEGVAKSLGIVAGSTVTLLASTIDGAMNSVDLQVKGVFRSFSKDYDARVLKMDLATAQELIDTRAANSVIVLLERTEQVSGAVREAAQRVQARGLVVRTWDELNPFYASTVELYDRQFAVLSLVILVMVALGVNNAVNMGVLERLAEFGTVRAIGNRNRHVFVLVVVEVGVLALAGACLGVVGGIAIAVLVSAVGIPMPPPPNSNVGYIARIDIVPSVVLQAFAVGLVSTLLAGILPALKVARIPIVRALGEVR